MTTAASPEHLVSDVVLRDGSTIRIRLARPVGTQMYVAGSCSQPRPFSR
jgi:hypothetical protein